MFSVGYVPSVPTPLEPGHVRHLKERLPLLNRLFLLMRQRPELGVLFSSRSHVYAEGVNVRHLAVALGRTVMRRVDKEGWNGRTVQPYIESSNRQLRVARIFERGTTRVEIHRQRLHPEPRNIVIIVCQAWVFDGRRKQSVANLRRLQSEADHGGLKEPFGDRRAVEL